MGSEKLGGPGNNQWARPDRTDDLYRVTIGLVAHLIDSLSTFLRDSASMYTVFGAEWTSIGLKFARGVIQSRRSESFRQ